ncbi:hypothetical protein [Rhodocaloribacter sp.]
MGHSIRHAGTSALLIVLLLLQQWPVTYVFGIFAQEAEPCTSAFCPLKRHTCRNGFCPMRRGAPPHVKGRAMHHGVERRGASNTAFAFTCSCERVGDTHAITLTLDHAVPPLSGRIVAAHTDTSHGATGGERPADAPSADIFRPPERHG